MRVLSRFAGYPEKRFPSIHIAGTNGKGSTSAFLASIFMEAGYRVGLYTSPHLVRFNERIKINGEEISDRNIIRYARFLRDVVDRTNATFFEATTCIAFKYFADEEVDIAVLETGLGGRLDATNVVRPLVSVITNVGFDHMQELGNTLPKIALEKGGIIKQGIPCVTGSHSPAVLETLRGAARRKRSVLLESNGIVRLTNAVNASGSYRVDLCSRHFTAKGIRLGFSGLHQIENARLAFAAVEMIRSRYRHKFSRINNRSVAGGLTHVQKNTALRGRLETIQRSRQYVLDVAHNPDGIAKLVSYLREKPMNRVIVFGVMADKDFRSMLRLLSPVAPRLIAVAPANTRALSVRRLTLEAKKFGIAVSKASSVRDGIALAEKGLRSGQVVITGSHYVAGEAMRYLNQFLTKSG